MATKTNTAEVLTPVKPASMQFTIERANLLRALGHVQSVVEKRGTIAVLSNVKIDAGKMAWR